MPDTDRPGPTSHSFIAQRLPLRYCSWGDPSAPTLILVHGGQDHARSWDWVANALHGDWHIVAPDLRGHGDSAWSPDGTYTMAAFVYDLAQLIHQLGRDEVTLVGHSLGGNIAVRYTALYPERVRRLVTIEGLGLSPEASRDRAAQPLVDRWHSWIETTRKLSALPPRRYPSIDDALARMRAKHQQLSEAQARHLTVHGVLRNEDGSFSWKYDPYVRADPPVDMTQEQLHAMWARIICPTLLAYGRDSWASNPAEDGRAAHFRNARTHLFDDAGHWLHHDQLDTFLEVLRAFL